MGGSKQTTQSETKSDPWAPAQPLLKSVLGNVETLGSNTDIFKPVISDTTQQAIAAARTDAMRPSESAGVFRNLAGGAEKGYGAGNEALMATARGDMLKAGGNPYLDSVLRTATDRAADKVNSAVAGKGRYGSDAHAGILADRLGAIETQGRMQDYSTERQNQLNASHLLTQQGMNAGGLATSAEGAEAAKVAQLMQAGQLQDARDTAIQTAPLNATQWQASLGIPIAGLGGQSSTTSTTKTAPNVAGMIGSGIMGGLGLMAGNPMALGNIGSNMGGLFGGGSMFAAPQMRSMNGYF